MKSIISIIILSFSFGFGFAQNSNKETIVIKSSIKCNHCMECGSCGENIYAAMENVEGVTNVKINPEENTIAVTYKTSKTNPEKIKTAISDAGFDADDVKAKKESYAKLDGCCKAD